MSDATPVRIVYKKKKGGAHGHHGGAWKVAFADFMTAMMALFMVLWIMAQSQEIKQAVAYYFRRPVDFEGKPNPTLPGGNGLMDNNTGRLDLPPSILDQKPSAKGATSGAEGQTPESISGGAAFVAPEPGQRPTINERNEEEEKAEARHFAESINRIWENIGMDPAYLRIKDQIFIQIVDDGLLVQLLERPQHPLFEEHSEQFVPAINRVISILGEEFGGMTNKIEIEGHGPGIHNGAEQKWLGSAALADMMRLALEGKGIRVGQITRVSGCADTRPLYAAKNGETPPRRVSILVRHKNWKPERY